MVSVVDQISEDGSGNRYVGTFAGSKWGSRTDGQDLLVRPVDINAALRAARAAGDNVGDLEGSRCHGWSWCGEGDSRKREGGKSVLHCGGDGR